MVVGPESPRVSRTKEGGGEMTWPGAKARKREDEAGKAAGGEATAGPENKIGREGSEQMTDRPGQRQIQQGPKSPYKKRRGQEPFEPIPEGIVVGPVRPCETDETGDDDEESWNNANEEGWEVACGKTKNGAAAEQEEEAKGRAEEDQVRNRHDRGLIMPVFRFGWDMIRAWIVQQKPDRGKAEAKRNQRPIGAFRSPVVPFK